MRIVIVGGRGFIGKPLAEKLARSHYVKVLDLPEADLRSSHSVGQKLDGIKPNLVINLAAVLGDTYSRNIGEIFETNVLGNINLVESCLAQGIKRYVFASSLTVHGENRIGEHHTIASLFKPKQAYSASKAAAEYSLMQYAKHHGMSVVTLRPTMVLGDTYMNHAPIDFIRTIVSGKDIELYGSGDHEREWIWVDDVADGFCRAIDFCGEVEPGYHPFFLSGNRISMKDLAEKCARALGGTVRHATSTAQAFTLTCDISESEKVLKWKPETDIDEMITRLIVIQKGKVYE